MSADLDPRDFLHVPCDCMEPLGVAHCHLCSDIPHGRSQDWPCDYADAQAAYISQAKAEGLEELATTLRKDGVIYVDPEFLIREAHTLRAQFDADPNETPAMKTEGRR